MAEIAGNICRSFNDFLFRRVPDFDKELARDRFPWNYLYSTMYETDTWPSFTGYEHTWDKVYVTRPNDDAKWDQVNSDACATDICDPSRAFTCWGSDRDTYGKFHRDYQSPVFCFDQLRHVEQAVAQLSAIIDGHKKIPDAIVSDFLRYRAARTANVLHICTATGAVTVPVTPAVFPNGSMRITLGGAAFEPTSLLSMNYLDNHIETLMYNGYHDREFLPEGKFAITSDIQTLRNLSNQNPTLTGMYNAADFVKGGKFYAYGVMQGVGNWLFKIDKEPWRFESDGAGNLYRIFPYENVAATVGKKPQLDARYVNAPIQMFHVYNRAARKIYVGDITPVNPEMKFGVARSLLGKWSWKSPDYFKAYDPNTGNFCEYNNDKKNKGYFLGEYELGDKTVYPEIEMIILALRQPQPVTAVPYCGTQPTYTGAQTLTPYCDFCAD